MFSQFSIKKGIQLAKLNLIALTACFGILSSNLSASTPSQVLNHQAVTSFGNAGTINYYKLVIPEGGTKLLSLSMEYFSGSGQLIFYPNNPPASPLYCQSSISGNESMQTCKISDLEQGTYYLQVTGNTDSFYGALVASYSDILSVDELVPGIWYEPSGVSGNVYDFTVTFPDTAREFELEFKPDNNTANAELLFTPLPVGGEAIPTYVTCPLPGNTYVCTYRQLAKGTYKVRLKANTDFTASKLLVRYALPLKANKKLQIKSGQENARYDFYYLPTGDETDSLVKLRGDVGDISMTVHNGVDKNDFSIVCETEDISMGRKACFINGNMTSFGYYYVALHASSNFTNARLKLEIPLSP